MRNYIRSIVAVARRRCMDLHGRPGGSACVRCLVEAARHPRQSHTQAQIMRAKATARRDVERLAERVHAARAWRAAGERITHIMAHFGISYATVWEWLHGDPFAPTGTAVVTP